MQAIEHKSKPKADFAQQYALAETRSPRVGKKFKEREDDCSGYDKLPKQIDDIVEGESPKRFKRPKMDSDIIAR